MASALHQLVEHGQSPWLDFLSRSLVRDGDLERLVRDDGLRGVTSNPTIFQKAIAAGDGYQEQLREVAREEDDPKRVFLALAVRDIQDACDVLRPVWDEGRGLHGWVSLEVDPTIAHDTEATIEEACRLHEFVDRPNVYIKIPATKAGLPAIEETIAAGVPVNVTLVFTLERHREVMEAYVRGVRRLIDAGGDASSVCSVASFFVSRVDTEIDKRLDAIGGHDELKHRMAIANAKLAYQQWKERFGRDDWRELEDRGATPQWCLWASTSTKDPNLPDTLYVEALVGADTVDTMPMETIEVMREQGEVRATLEEGLDDARALFDELRDAGVDLDDAFEVLEREGVEKFEASFSELLEEVSSKRSELVGA